MPMRCYYEVLGAMSDAGQEDLKRLYRQAALKWHPDKNIGNEIEAHTQFQEIREAYSVLSDPQERAWYDKHKDQILNSSTEEDSCYNLFPFFTASCYKDFSDSPEGFYSVYRNVFENLAEEHEVIVNGSQQSPPSFGDSNSSYLEVVENFYNYWSNYLTKRTFAWQDDKICRQHGRKAVKMVERQNNKRREKLRKERNEEVRNLVSFVKKRDKRVAVWAIKMKEEKAEKQSRLEDLRKEQIVQNLRQKELYEECEWSKFSLLEEELVSMEKNIDERYNEPNNEDSGSESDDDNFSKRKRSLFCIACNKLFQSEKAFANHEGSKKHKQKAALLQTDDEDTN